MEFYSFVMDFEKVFLSNMYVDAVGLSNEQTLFKLIKVYMYVCNSVVGSSQ